MGLLTKWRKQADGKISPGPEAFRPELDEILVAASAMTGRPDSAVCLRIAADSVLALDLALTDMDAGVAGSYRRRLVTVLEGKGYAAGRGAIGAAMAEMGAGALSAGTIVALGLKDAAPAADGPPRP